MFTHLDRSVYYSKHYRILSKYRLYESVSTTDFNYNISIPSNGHYRAIILRAIIPKVYNNIQDSENTLTLIENGIEIPITITSGVYNIDSFADALKSALDAASLNTYTYTITKNETTGKYTFTSSGLNCGLVTNTSVNAGLNICMGLNDASTYTFPFESINGINFNHHENIIIHSDLVVNNTLCVIDSSKTISYDYITYQYQNSVIDSHPINYNKNHIYNFKLIDSNGIALNLQQNWSFDLLIFSDTQQAEYDFYNDCRLFMNYMVKMIDTIKTISQSDQQKK